MEALQRCALSFSGGKDSLLALDRARRQGLSVEYLVTMYDQASQRVRFHRVSITLIQAQADRVGLPLLTYPNSAATFETVFFQSRARATPAGDQHNPLWQYPPGRCARLARGTQHRSRIGPP